MLKLITVAATCLSLFGPALFIPSPGIVRAGSLNEGVIYPGRGIDRLKIGSPAPDARTLRADRRLEGVRISAVNGIIGSITITSFRYGVERNGLKTGSTLSEVLRFYGTGEKGMSGDTAILRYPEQGIEFAFDTAAERVNSITIFRPVRQRPSVEQQRKLYRYHEQLKAR